MFSQNITTPIPLGVINDCFYRQSQSTCARASKGCQTFQRSKILIFSPLQKHLLHKLTQETQESWFKVLPIALMRARTAPKKKRLSLWQSVFVHRYCHRPQSLRINYVTQLSAFQPPHQLKASHGGFLCFKGRTFFNSANLMTSSNHKMDWNNTSYLNYGHNVTFNFDCVLI